MRLTGAAVLTVIGIVSMAACRAGGRDRDESTPPPAAVAAAGAGPSRSDRPAVCSLIDQREMSRILGGAVAAPQPRGSSTCTYRPAVENALTPYAEVTIDWTGGEQAMKGMRLAGKVMDQDAGFSVFQKIDGVGDEATMLFGGVMNVRKGVVLITIDLRMQDEQKEKGSAIANTILARVRAGGATT